MKYSRCIITRLSAAWLACAAIIISAVPNEAMAQNSLAPPAAVAQQQAISYTQGPRGLVQFATSGNGSTVTLPVSQSGTLGYSRQSGFQLSVDTNWPGQYGYRPIVFTLKSRKPAPVDRQITITFTAGDWSPPRGKAISVEQSFTFPAGATSASEKLLVPRLQDWQMATWRVKVDGRSDDFLAIDQLHFAGIGIGQTGIGAMALGLTPEQVNETNTLLQASSNGVGVNLVTMDGKELPTNWLEYSSLDVFIMPAADLAGLARVSPKQTAALLRWVRSGGNLWLIQCGGQWGRLPDAEQVLGVPGGAEDDEDASPEAAVESRGWRFAPIGERSLEPSEGATILSGFDAGEDKSWRKLVASVVAGEPAPQRQFVVRGFGLGAVAAFRFDLEGADVTNGSATYTAITQSLLGPRITWGSRYGNQPDIANDSFNNLLIPNVGVAPVGQFQFLITLFVLGIGPLNYWLLKRSNKLPLLLATAPAAAAATTLVLFGYGLMADGFDVQARSRTLTLLDQRAGEAVAWGRFSYYAGIAPRDGLQIPADQMMLPIMPRWSASRYGGRASSAPRQLVWEGDQELRRGWLASRTPTQYHAITARPSSKRLEMRVTNDGLRIVNRLGVDVTHVGVEDHDGRFYWCEDLADGAGRVVPATEQGKLASGIRQLFTANIPEAPGGDEIRYGGYYGNTLSQSLMEGRLEAINSPAVRSWGPGKYIAFTKQAIELDLGLDDVAEEASFHVIEGSW